jgi:NADH-quinone oxidoreductase subunit L
MHLEQPGLLYVAATLLPLASFVLLLLVGGVRSLLRSQRHTALGESLYRTLGGDTPGRGAAYVATGAIGLACVLSLVGFVIGLPDNWGHEATEGGAEQHAGAAPEDHRWSDRINWNWVGSEPEGEEKYNPAPGTTLQLGFHIDSLSAVMFVMVTFIATLIHIFSIGYMSEELPETVEDHQVHTEDGHLHRRGRFGRFFLFLSLFCFSMLNLILADNLFQVFLSWELVGVCSYLLIGFYFERHSASTAANKAFITNRVGDAGFIIGLLILWTYVGSFNFDDIFKQVRAPMRGADGKGEVLAAQIVRGEPEEGDGPGKLLRVSPTGSEVVLFPAKLPEKFRGPAAGDIIRANLDAPATEKSPPYRSMPYWALIVAGLGIFLGCVGKSAQFPLHVWLPDAMEGPTPVSALIHAATMVAAGVYLVGRTFPLFTPEARLVIAYTGGITLFVAATIAVVMTDIKKVLAYSTVSQLGYMMLALGIGGWVAGLFHLVTHAFFKALLFLGSGSVIYGCHHEQDMRKMGGLYPKMKITALTMLVGVLAIAGTPWFSGWYSKDAIIAQAFGYFQVHHEHLLLFLLPLLTAGLTTFYMYRMWFMTFVGQPRDHHVYEHAHESPATMTLPLILLAAGSIFVAYGPKFWQPEDSPLEQLIHHSQPNSVIADFGHVISVDPKWAGADESLKEERISERHQAHAYQKLGGLLALGMMALGVIFAGLLYWRRALDPAEAQAQFPGVHAFLEHKWYFDELYSAILVRPALVVAHWFRAFDTNAIDGFVNNLARIGVLTSKWDGIFDAAIVDGLVNLTANVCYAVGARLRSVQTGFIRSYVLFLALAAVAIFVILSYFFVSMASAG